MTMERLHTRQHASALRRVMGCVLLVLWITPVQAQEALRPLWQIGKADDSAGEFAPPTTGGALTMAVPGDWATRTDWSAFPDGLRGDTRPALEITYDLPAVPEHGVLFSCKLLQAPKSGAQMGVFSNRTMAGLLQLWGTAGSQSTFRWHKTYRLNIPREMLAVGRNVLRLETVRPIWSDARVDKDVWWQWDWMGLGALAFAAREPIHGSVAYLGTTLRQSSGFVVNDDTVRLAPAAFSWLGIAYSGNTIRCDFWFDVGAQQPRRLEYLQQLRDLNLTALVDFVSGSHFRNDKGGTMPTRIQDAMAEFFARYGALFQYYELGNEPCMFGGGLAETLETGRMVNRLKPAHVKAVAVGWAYGGGKGTPLNWDANAANRRRVEALCQATNGHSYGYSYADDRGGSFMETLQTYGGVADGWPVEFINSETGTNDWHSEENGPRLSSAQPHAQAFDRIIRAHLAVVNRTMQHAAVFDGYGLFHALAAPVDPTTLTSLPGINGERESRLQTYRRLALAYATHGAPLAYRVRNADAVGGKKVYVRCVDTAALPALGGSGGTASKLLLNLVNFENAAQSLRVQVTLPAKGTYAGERFGAGATYAAARSAVQLQATPTVDLSEYLGPGEAVQYILTPPGRAAPYPPTDVRVRPGAGQLEITWAGSCGATAYEVQRSAPTRGTEHPTDFAVIARGLTQTRYVDERLPDGAAYAYRIVAVNDAGRGESGAATRGIVGLPLAPTALTAVPGDQQIALRWMADGRAGSYLIKRFSGSAGAAMRVFDNIKEPRFADKDLTNGTSYRYEVFSVGGAGVSDEAAVVQATPENPPAPPQDLSATAGAQRVVLRWSAVPGALTYVVGRSSGEERTQVRIADDVAENAYIDNDVVNGQTYRYTVAARKVALASADSAVLAATPAADALPAPWQQADIGRVGKDGQAFFTSGTPVFTVLGAGEDVWGQADGGHLVYQPLAGDGQIVARVAHCDDTHPWARVGVMLRQSTSATAPMVVLAYQQAMGCGLTYRATAGGPCAMIGGDAERWLKIVRQGDAVQGFISADGVHWRQRGAARVALGDHAVVGLFVCSHRNDTLNRTLFDQVAVGTRP